jgi:hypothetical protein
MKLLKNFNLITKLTFIIAITLFVYGIICRIIPIYFFWESLYFSGIIFLIGLILFLNSEIKKKKSDIKSSDFLKFGKVLIYLFIILIAIITTFFNSSDPIKIAKDYIKNNSKLNNEIGKIESVFALPIGTLNTKTNKNGKSGNATLILLVKGKKKFKEMKVSIQKDIDSDWRIIGMK